MADEASPPESPPVPPVPPAPPRNPNPLHGVTLERMLTELVDDIGWAAMGARIPIRCFTHDPSVKSSLQFLRRTPWAREKVEGMYLYRLRERARQARRAAD